MAPAKKWTLWLIGLVALAVPTIVAAQAAPQVSLTETSHDFGTVFEDQALTHQFVLKNTGQAPLKIENVDPDCACTVAQYDQTIPPGGQGQITLSIKPYSVMHQFRKQTKVALNDPAKPEVVLALTGTVKPLIEIKPGHIVRLRGKVEDDLQAQVRFVSNLSGPWEIKEARTNIPEQIEINLKAEEPGRVYVLEVRNKRREPGHYAGLVELLTTSEKRPRLIVRVFANIYPARQD
jgi:hypothetical protein